MGVPGHSSQSGSLDFNTESGFGVDDESFYFLNHYYFPYILNFSHCDLGRTNYLWNEDMLGYNLLREYKIAANSSPPSWISSLSIIKVFITIFCKTLYLIVKVKCRYGMLYT